MTSISRVLPDLKIVILVVSTSRLGANPASCKQIRLKLQSPDPPLFGLAGVKFCVFGMGDPLTASPVWPLPASTPITRRLGKTTISDVDIITPGASRLALQHADR